VSGGASLADRMIRALWIFGVMFVGYVTLIGVTAIVGTWEKDKVTGREVERVPEWVKRWKKSLDQRNAKRLLRGMLELRGVYIKLGQILSIMGGFLPRVYTKELEQLQDAVPHRPFDEIEKAFFVSLGARPDELFSRFEETPIAAASLGQVHLAWLTSSDGSEGRKVAVKVLYPGIRDVIKVDMQVIRLAVIVYKWFVPVAGIERVHEALVDLLRRETEYLHEAECMRRMAKNFEREKDILFPEPIAELTTSDVLTMTFMEGIKINKLDELRAANIDPHSVATRFVESFYKQLFVDRFFHADPHPGNFLVQPGRNPRRPKIVILDFGAVSEVKDSMVDGLIDVIGGLLEHDGKKLLDGFLRMGFASEEANHDLLERTVETYFQRLLQIKDRTPGALMRANRNELEQLVDPEVAREELRELMRSVEYPEGWFYVERASVLAFWLVGQIDPDVDAMRVGYPYVMPLLQEKLKGISIASLLAPAEEEAPAADVSPDASAASDVRASA
jgi:predicted unusual protein kinase regulating ubiquinone biosynthesis (AarF/ABC1/UbiB family)